MYERSIRNRRVWREPPLFVAVPSTRANSLFAAVALLAVALLSGCGPAHQDTPGPTRLTLWAHSGQPEERAVLTAQVKSFEAAHPGTTVELKQISDSGQDDYNDKVQAAITAGNMPDLLLVDGPNIASYAYQGGLTPLDGLLDPQVRDRMLPSLVAQGTWNGHLWAVGSCLLYTSDAADE